MRKLLFLVMLFSSLSLAQPATVRQFVYRIEPVRKDLTLQNLTDVEKPILAQHAAYLKKLLDDGKLVLAGQAFEQTSMWGIVIVNAADAPSAEAIMTADPAFQAKIFQGKVVPFRVVFQAGPKL